ncbi:MAG: Fumarate hydratase class II [Methanonatronarchaeales archaeon]|nr:Fumarate hydratase class II [Methanonatronarchaeales archaeon]
MYRKERLGAADDGATSFTSSLDSDEWIFDADLLVDRAHLVMLAEQGLVGREGAAEIADALDAVGEEGFSSLAGEDVHEAIEARVVELVGEEGGRLHTARSRNDEVATCIRLAARGDVLRLMNELIAARGRLLDTASESVDTLIPAYTHLQRAQPTTLAHHLSAHERRLARDSGRLFDVMERLNRSPLGGCAAASTTLPIDRERTSELLGFEGPVENSMDAVSARDFATELLFVCSSVMEALSRLAEEVVLWSSSEFGVMELDDGFATTSSVMPQKKNPDVAELVRARAATVQGHLQAALSIVSGIPLSYNRDLQELTPHLSDSLRVAARSARVLSRAVESAEFREPGMELEVGATDLAEALVERGVPFREAHARVGRLSRTGFGTEDAVDALGDRLTRGEVGEALDFHRSVELRVNGGPGSAEELLDLGRRDLKSHGDALREIEGGIDRAYSRLEEVLAEL